MHVTKNTAKYRKGEGIEIWNYLTSESGTSISVAYAELRGNHKESISKDTDRCYIFTSGKVNFYIEDQKYDAKTNEVIYVEKGKRHSFSGNANYFVINNPPYKKNK